MGISFAADAFAMTSLYVLVEHRDKLGRQAEQRPTCYTMLLYDFKT